jgi:hypothetical protein
MRLPRTTACLLTLATLTLALAPGEIRAGEPRWKKHTINGKSEFEAAGVLDVDGDGKLDIVSGDTWYRAPDWTPAHVRDVVRQGTYYNCFATLPMDVNGDGKTDYVTVAYFPRNVGWVENPGVAGKDWTYHEIDLPGTSEAAALADLNGDGRPDVLPNPTNVVVWYELAKAGPKPEWIKHDLGKAAAGHGVGSGDVNGDGRVDLLTPKGWFEAPANRHSDAWAWHAEWQASGLDGKDLKTGIQMLARDVNGDGLADVVYGMGHNYGLFWLEQGKGTGGERTWTKHTIDAKLAQAHTLLWADLDGDGKDDELVTGKRVYAHEVEPGATDGSLIGYYRFDRKAGAWTRHPIYEGEPASNPPARREDRLALKDFPAGTAGTGLQMTAIDLDRDGDLDLVCPGKSGLYYFENLGGASKP